MRRWRTWGVLAALAAFVALALPGVGQAATPGITLNRAPSPPQAIVLGGAEQFDWAVTYTSVAQSVVMTVIRPNGVPTTVVSNTYTSPFPGDGITPLAGTAFFQTTGLDLVGRYTASLVFNSNQGAPETTATAIFDVAPALGTLVVTKYEDMNGNGVQEPGEPLVPNWPFNLVNPSGGASTVTSGAAGTATFPGVPAGTWQVGEPGLPGWAFITPAGGVGTVTVPANGVGTFAAGNARPAPLSGLVWVDANRNGVLDAGEQPRGGVLVTLTGVTGTGGLIGGQTATLADGTYIFGGLLPGTYSVSIAVPAGFTNTTPTTLGGIPMVSNTPSPNHNFGIVPAPAPAAQTPAGVTPARRAAAPAPGLTLTKSGPGTAQPGQVVTYTLRVSNPGAANARNVVVTDPVPKRMTFVSSKPKSTLDNGVVTWRLGTLKPKASRTLTLKLRLDPTAPAGKYTNTATARATGIGPRRARTTLTVAGPPPAPRTGGVTG